MRDPLDGMVGQQLEDADILPGAGAETEPLFEVAAQVGERWRQVPIAVDRGVVQGRRFALQNHQKMQGIEHFFAVAIAASVRCHLLPVGDHDDALDVPFHRHRAEGEPPRDAVTVVVEAHRLVLIDLSRLEHASIEGAVRHGQRRGEIVLETLAD